MVGLCTVPHAVMKNQYRSRFANCRNLSDKVLVSCYISFTYQPKVTTRENCRSSHFTWGIVAKIHKLDIEVHPGVDNGIRMPNLSGLILGIHNMGCLMIVKWIWANQAVDDPLDFR